MMKTKSLLIVFFFLTSPMALLAQEVPDEGMKGSDEQEEPFFHHDIGFVLNDHSQIGLSYRHWFGNKLKNFGFQTSMASHSLQSGNGLSIHGSFSFLYMLNRSEHVNLFLYQKNGISYSEVSGTRYSGESFFNTNRAFGNSIGFGIEVIALKRLSINLTGGYGVTTYNSSHNSSNESQIGLEAEIGLFYKF